MDTLKLAIDFINAAIYEMQKLQEYNDAMRDCTTEDEILNVKFSFLGVPTEKGINDKLKFARQLILAAYLK